MAMNPADPAGITLSSTTRRTGSSAIRDLLAIVDRPGMISLAGGMLAPETFPSAALVEAVADVVRDNPLALQYSSTLGFEPLRRWVGAQEGVSPEQVVVTAGSQQAVDLLARVLDALHRATPGAGRARRAVRLRHRRRHRLSPPPLHRRGAGAPRRQRPHSNGVLVLPSGRRARSGPRSTAEPDGADDRMSTGVQIWIQSSSGARTVAMSVESSVDGAVLLRRHGLQVTAQRLAVLRAVSGRPHSTADDIDKVVRAEIGAISHQAVYNALGTLTDKGLLRRIQPAESAARYENRIGDNHHHLICRGCRRMVDVDCAVGDTPCLTAADDAGYEIDEAEVIYWGRCPECVAATSQRESRATSHQKESTRQEKDRRV
jgi:Fur family ferric uptake transcriptional regulator